MEGQGDRPQRAGSLHSRAESHDQSQSTVRVAGVRAEGCCDVRGAGTSQEGDGGVAQGRHDLRRSAGAHLATVLIEGHIPHPMQSVFDGPMSSDQLQQALRIRFVRRKTGDQVMGLLRCRSALGHASRQARHLGQMRPVRPAIQRGRSGKFADLVPIPAPLSRPRGT
jgi:hypothetical protein